MDYAFAPGATAQDIRVRRMFSRRSDTTLIAKTKTRKTVRDFIEYLHASSSVTRPIDDILVASHANSRGQLFLPMFRGQSGPTQFETLEDTISDASKSIAVQDSLTSYQAGDPVTHSFHFKGCNIGKARPFLVKMKEAVGGNLLVTAPLHFHGIYWHSRYGVWELMAYEFRLLRKTRFTNRADLITAFNEEGFTYYNGDPITLADWEQWIPSKINRTKRTTVTLPLGVTIARRTTIPFKREFRYKRDKYTFTLKYPSPRDVPTDSAARMSALETGINESTYRTTDSIGSFDPAHPFPEYERWGYSSKQDFIDEHSWQFSKSGKRLICRGIFYAYTVSVPITERISGNIIFNFYPNPGSGHTATRNLLEDDSRFFAKV